MNPICMLWGIIIYFKLAFSVTESYVSSNEVMQPKMEIGWLSSQDLFE